MSKFCQGCGAQCTDEAAFCSACGTRLTTPNNQPQAPTQCPPTTAQIPVYAQPIYVKPKIPGRGFGISSMVLGIVGLVYSFMGFSIIQSSTNVTNLLSPLLMLLSMPVLALCFSLAARKRGYQNGISTSGLVLGSIALGIYVLAFAAVASLIK